MTAGQLGEGLGQPGVWVHARDLAVFDEGGDHRPVVAALIRAREQRVLAIEGQRPDRPLDGVGVQLDAAIIQEQRQSGPAGQRVADGVGELALGADLTEPCLEVDVQIIEDDAELLPVSGPPCWRFLSVLTSGRAMCR